MTGGAERGCRQVLYVEDNMVNARLMEAICAGIPEVELVIVGDAEEALALLRERPFALVLMDIQLPGMSGIEAFEKIRANAALENLPVIAVSASAAPQDIAEAGTIGFVDYFVKPLRVVETRRRLRATLGI